MTMTPKPLSKERRDEIRGFGCSECLLEEVVTELLAAEALWREAIKKAPEWINESDGCDPDECLFCKGSRDYVTTEIVHKPDCSWLLAQDSKEFATYGTLTRSTVVDYLCPADRTVLGLQEEPECECQQREFQLQLAHGGESLPCPKCGSVWHVTFIKVNKPE